MLSSKFINFMKALNSGKVENLNCVLNLGRVGLRMAEEYSTRFDLLSIEQCLFLSEFQTPKLEKAEKHLLNLIEKNAPLFSLMEYYDNYPYAYSDINYFFKGCLKSGVEISIKAVNPVAKNNYLKKIHKLDKSLKFHCFFKPWLEKKYQVKEVLDKLEKHSHIKFDLANEIRATKSLEDYLKAYKDIDFLKRVRFPKIYSYLSSNNVIVSEFIYGSYFYELLNYKKLTYSDVLDLIRAHLFFMLKVGTFHNNLHSGNLILGDDSNIYFLDCNNVYTLKSQVKESVFNIFKAIPKENFGEIAYQISRISTNNLSEEFLEKLILDMKTVFSSDRCSLIKKIMRVFKVASDNGVIFDEDIFSIFKSLIYLDKLVSKTKTKESNFFRDFEKILDNL